jgi:DNA-binding MarR family transcriptional regulator
VQRDKNHPAHPAPIAIRDLLSYRLHVVANLMSRGAAMRYRREFDVTLWEWRIIALLGGYAPLSLNELARSAGLDKSQASRVVSGLIERSLVLRNADENDGRGIRLSLSKAGRRVYTGLMNAAAERNAAFLSRLTRDERACFDQMLAKLADEARQFINEEKLISGRQRGRRRAA